MKERGPSIMPPAFNVVAGEPIQAKKKDEEGSALGDNVANGADKVNAIGNILDPILEKFVGKSNQAIAAAKELMREAAAAGEAAKVKAAKALQGNKTRDATKSLIYALFYDRSADVVSRAAESHSETGNFSFIRSSPMNRIASANALSW